MRRHPGLVCSLALATLLTTTATVFVIHTYDEMVGTYLGFFGASTLQLMTLRAERTGTFIDAGYGSHRVEGTDNFMSNPVVYQITVVDYHEDGSMKLQLTPVNGGHPITLNATGSYELIEGTIPSTPYARSRKLVLHRQEIIERLLDEAHAAAQN